MPKVQAILINITFITLFWVMTSASHASNPVVAIKKSTTKSSNQRTADTYNRLLQRQIAKFGLQHKQVARTYEKLGLAYYKLEQYNKALESQKKALKIVKKLDKKSPRISYIYNNIALAYLEKRRHRTALFYLKKALKFDLKVFGKNHPYIGTLYNSFGLVYKRQGKTERAKAYYKKSIKILRASKDSADITSLADSYYNLGILYLEQRKYDRAISYFKKTLNIDIKHLGDFHISVAEDYNNIGLAYRKKGRLAKARKYFNLAADTAYHISGKEGPEYAKYVKYLNSTLRRQIRRYLRIVRKHIVSNLAIPKNKKGREKVYCKVKLKQNNKGLIMSARITCDPNYKSVRHAVAKAVSKSSPLPLPKAAKVFDQSITIRLKIYQ